MSQEAAPDQEAAHQAPAPAQQDAPKGLLQQMEELMAALNADLTQLDADLQQSTSPGTPSQGAPATPSADPAGPGVDIGTNTGTSTSSAGSPVGGTRPRGVEEPGLF